MIGVFGAREITAGSAEDTVELLVLVLLDEAVGVGLGVKVLDDVAFSPIISTVVDAFVVTELLEDVVLEIERLVVTDVDELVTDVDELVADIEVLVCDVKVLEEVDETTDDLGAHPVA
jgi:hypothetical protein